MALADSKQDIARAHRHFAAECFNRAWTLMEKPDRTPENDEQMVLLALSSLWHWTQRADCTDRNLSMGHWQVSRVYASLGDGNKAMHHAQRCLALAEGSPAFYIAYAHEALALAALITGDHATAQRHLAQARSLAQSVTDAEEKQLLEQDLAALTERLA